MDIKTLKMIRKVNTAIMLINLMIIPIVIYGLIIREPFAVVVSIMALSTVCRINRNKVFGNVLLAVLIVIIAQLFHFIDLTRNERSGYTVMLFFMLLLVGVREMCSHYIHKLTRDAELEVFKHGYVKGYCDHSNLYAKASGYSTNTGDNNIHGYIGRYEVVLPKDTKITNIKENSDE